MLNLLPQEEKKRLISEYRLKFAIMVAIFACLLLVIASVGLFPTYISEKVEMDGLVKQKQEADKYNTQEMLQEADKQKAENKILADYLEARVIAMEASPSFSSILTDIFARKNQSITINAVNLNGKALDIRGVAATRAELIAFHGVLRQHSPFKNATLPISDIAKSVNADFAIQITLP